MQEHLLGIDIGTDGCKSTSIDCDGDLIPDGVQSGSPANRLAEHPPNDWMSAVVHSLESVKQKSNANF